MNVIIPFVTDSTKQLAKVSDMLSVAGKFIGHAKDSLPLAKSHRQSFTNWKINTHSNVPQLRAQLKYTLLRHYHQTNVFLPRAYVFFAMNM